MTLRYRILDKAGKAEPVLEAYFAENIVSVIVGDMGEGKDYRYLNIS